MREPTREEKVAWNEGNDAAFKETLDWLIDKNTKIRRKLETAARDVNENEKELARSRERVSYLQAETLKTEKIIKLIRDNK